MVYGELLSLLSLGIYVTMYLMYCDIIIGITTYRLQRDSTVSNNYYESLIRVLQQSTTSSSTDTCTP